MENIRNLRPDDPEAAKIFDILTERITEHITLETSDIIAKANIAYVIGGGMELAERFAMGEWRAYQEVGHLQSGRRGEHVSIRLFWEIVAKCYQGRLTSENVNYLVREDTAGAFAFTFVFILRMMLSGGVMASLSANAHAYK